MSKVQQRHDISDKVWNPLGPHLPGARLDAVLREMGYRISAVSQMERQGNLGKAP